MVDHNATAIMTGGQIESVARYGCGDVVLIDTDEVAVQSGRRTRENTKEDSDTDSSLKDAPRHTSTAKKSAGKEN